MYTGPIIDPHHHLWDLSMGKHPWLSPDNEALRALADLSAIAHDYLPRDYVRDAAHQRVVATVHIEALWGGDPVGETRWLDTLDKGSGVALRYVANARLGTDEAARLIDEQAGFDRVVGVRGILSHHPTEPAKSFVADPNLGFDAAWRRDVGRLRDRGLHLELMMYPYQVEAVVDLARSFPDLTVVINHCGSPIDRDPEGMRRWRDGLRTIAALPNLLLKVSNPGAYDPDRTVESLRAVILHCIDCFGTDRTMFGTDYPVSRLQMTFDAIYDAFKRAVEPMTATEQRDLFFANARRVYRLEEAVPLDAPA